MAIALMHYGLEDNAEPLIETLSRDRDPILRYGAMFTIGLAYAGTNNNSAIRRLLHVAVSDVSDDVRRAAVINLGFVLFRTTEQVLHYKFVFFTRHGMPSSLSLPTSSLLLFKPPPVSVGAPAGVAAVGELQPARALRVVHRRGHRLCGQWQCRGRGPLGAHAGGRGRLRPTGRHDRTRHGLHAAVRGNCNRPQHKPLGSSASNWSYFSKAMYRGSPSHSPLSMD